MNSFAHYHRSIDLVNNPNYDFVSYNINPNLNINSNGSIKTIERVYESETFSFDRRLTKQDKDSIHLFFSSSLTGLSIIASFYILANIIMVFVFSELKLDDRTLWFIIFGITFLAPLLFGFYKLIGRLIRLNKNYRHLNYQVLTLSNRMLFDNRTASSRDISDAIENLMIFFDKNYYSFDNGKQIKRFFEKRYQQYPLSYYDNFKEKSVSFAFNNKSTNSIFSIVAELILGILGTVFNVIKDYSIIGPVFDKILFLLSAILIFIASMAYLSYSFEVYRMKEVFCYYYVYSYLFLKSVTNKNIKSTYTFCFGINNSQESMTMFGNIVSEIVIKNEIPAMQKDIRINYEKNNTIVTIYGVNDRNATLEEGTTNRIFDDFINWYNRRL